MHSQPRQRSLLSVMPGTRSPSLHTVLSDTHAYIVHRSRSVDLPVEEVPPELPEPVLGINFARDGGFVCGSCNSCTVQYRGEAASQLPQLGLP